MVWRRCLIWFKALLKEGWCIPNFTGISLVVLLRCNQPQLSMLDEDEEKIQHAKYKSSLNRTWNHFVLAILHTKFHRSPIPTQNSKLELSHLHKAFTSIGGTCYGNTQYRMWTSQLDLIAKNRCKAKKLWLGFPNSIIGIFIQSGTYCSSIPYCNWERSYIQEVFYKCQCGYSSITYCTFSSCEDRDECSEVLLQKIVDAFICLWLFVLLLLVRMKISVDILMYLYCI